MEKAIYVQNGDNMWNHERKCCKVTKINSWIIWKLNQKLCQSVNNGFFLLCFALDIQIKAFIFEICLRMTIEALMDFWMHLSPVGCRQFLHLMGLSLEISSNWRISHQTNRQKKKLVIESITVESVFFDRL